MAQIVEEAAIGDQLCSLLCCCLPLYAEILNISLQYRLHFQIYAYRGKCFSVFGAS